MVRFLLRVTALLLLMALPTSAYVQTPEASKTAELNALFTTADLMDATVAELLAAMEDGRLTSERLVQMYLDRIEAYDEALELHSVIAVNPNALDEARQADADRAAGKPLGRLHGIPFIVKDNIDVAGMATTQGSWSLLYAIADTDAEVIARLRAEGAIVLAKANMSEFAQYGHNSRSGVGGIAHNPYDLDRTPAGSSGGTAIAVTCNFAAFGLGTDTGSSIRRPASFADIYALRPSFGMVSQYGLARLNSNQDVIGPMCRTPEDMALVMDIIAGSDEKDSHSAEADAFLPSEGYTACRNAAGLQGKRIGYLANSFGYYYDVSTDQPLKQPTPLDEKIVGMVEQTISVFEAGGATMVDISALLPESMIAAYSYDTTSYGRTRFREVVTKLLAENGIDAVMYISQTDVAQIEVYSNDDKNNPAIYINEFGPVAGLPEIMLPMGFSETDSENGFDHPMPLGASLFAGYGQEAVLLEIAYAYAQLAQVREQPWTTPALPDAALVAFAQQLLADAEKLPSANYSAESFAAVMQAAGYLRRLNMLGYEPIAYGEEHSLTVGVSAYQEAVLALAEAYDALEAPAISVVPAVMITELPEAVCLPAEEAASEETNTTAVWLIGMGAAAAVSVILWQRRRSSLRC